MNMNQIRAPIPKRAPKFVMPKSPAPWDLAAAITAIEHDVYQALVKEPAEAAGITPLPELPGPGTLVSMVVSPLQNLLGGLTKVGPGGQGGGQGAETKRGTITEEKPPAPPGGVATRGSL